MTTQTIRGKYLYSERAQRIQDFFWCRRSALWAVLLGLSPVLAFHMLMGS